eukprot:RCo055527
MMHRDAGSSSTRVYVPGAGPVAEAPGYPTLSAAPPTAPYLPTSARPLDPTVEFQTHVTSATVPVSPPAGPTWIRVSAPTQAPPAQAYPPYCTPSKAMFFVPPGPSGGLPLPGGVSPPAPRPLPT